MRDAFRSVRLMSVPRVELAPGYEISRLIKGGWQDIGSDPSANDDLIRYAMSGITTFETSDAYPGGEERLGIFLDRMGRGLPESRKAVRVHTRFTVPLSGAPPSRVVESVNRSLRLLGLERLDLLQLQCWNLKAPGLADVVSAMVDMQRQGKVRLLGVCNMGVEPLQRLLGLGMPVATNQVPYSLVDRRADSRLAGFCERSGISLLTYGPLAGGFLTGAWRLERDPESSGRLYSHEYLQIVRSGMGWQGLQALLLALERIAVRMQRTLAQIALRWALQRGPGQAVLFGATGADRCNELIELFEFELSEADCRALEEEASDGPPGDVGDLERAPNSPLGRAIRRHLELGPVD